jgi:hypothetical protein
MYEILSLAMQQGELQRGQELGTEARERMSVLCIAYHNLAVEHEYLKNYQSALSAYREGIRWAKDFLGEDHQIHQILQYSFNAVLKAQQGKSNEKELRKAQRSQQAQQANPYLGKQGGPPGRGPPSMELSNQHRGLVSDTPRDTQAEEEEREATKAAKHLLAAAPATADADEEAAPGTASPRGTETSELYKSDFIDEDASYRDLSSP